MVFHDIYNSKKSLTNQGSNEQCIMKIEFQQNAYFLSESESESGHICWLLDLEGGVNVSNIWL